MDEMMLRQVTPDQAYKTLERMCQKGKLRRMGTVSYTHLTLPTNREV